MSRREYLDELRESTPVPVYKEQGGLEECGDKRRGKYVNDTQRRF